MNLRAVHLDVRDKVLVEPIPGEAQVIRWGGEEVESPGTVQVLQTQQVLYTSTQGHLQLTIWTLHYTGTS